MEIKKLKEKLGLDKFDNDTFKNMLVILAKELQDANVKPMSLNSATLLVSLTNVLRNDCCIEEGEECDEE